MDQPNQPLGVPDQTPSPVTSTSADAATAAPLNTTHPFDEISLALSGGGYRAAAFHLGTLDMLHRLDLLQSVHVLSTVSGGTLTGLKYALSVTEGVSFEDFYRNFFDFLTETNVIGQGLEGLKPRKSVFSGQMPSLIRSAAQVYASPNMLGNKTFGLILNDEMSHLREASFNATEFRTANYFRFQRSASRQARIGNGNLSVRRDVAEMIRLADIAAASSCFPSAFEPIRFPDDFLWPRDIDEIRNALGDSFEQCVPLMDGGIFDNQGVDSVMRAYARGNNQNKIGLLIVSDTSQRNPSLFSFAPKKRRGFLTLSMLVKAAWIVFFVAVITTGVLIGKWALAVLNDRFHWIHVFQYGVPIIFSIVLALGLGWVRRQYQEAQRRVAEMTTVELWPFLKRLTMPELIDLISGRAKSLIALTASVFMKRVRGMVYEEIKKDEDYRDRQVANLIYDLDDTRKFGAIVNDILPNEALRDLAIRAEEMETTLWINDPQELRNLVACGQATTCFNIMRYILDSRRAELNTSGSREEQVYKNAEALWELLKKDRYAFLRR